MSLQRMSSVFLSYLVLESVSEILVMTRSLQSSLVGIRRFLYNHWLIPFSVEDIYTPNLVKEAVQVFGADDPAHPSVAYLRNRVNDRYLGGKVQAIQSPTHFDYVALRCECLVLLYFTPYTDALNSTIRYTLRAPIALQKAGLAQGCCLPDP